MTFRIEVTPQANAEIARAANEFDAHRPGWGDLFLDEYEYVVRQIRAYPESYQRVNSICRRVVLRKFPFIVVYRLQAELIEIIGVFPAQADPSFMMTRIERSSH